METTYFDSWNYCVSVASSFLPLSWKEYFFKDGEKMTAKETAHEFAKKQREKGYAVLVVDQDEY